MLASDNPSPGPVILLPRSCSLDHPLKSNCSYCPFAIFIPLNKKSLPITLLSLSPPFPMWLFCSIQNFLVALVQGHLGLMETRIHLAGFCLFLSVSTWSLITVGDCFSKHHAFFWNCNPCSPIMVTDNITFGWPWYQLSLWPFMTF